MAAPLDAQLTKKTSFPGLKVEVLEEKMAVAGFTQERMRFHHSLCDFFEREQLPMDGFVICGSFAEGWGCNPSCMSGQVSDDSDVDVTIIHGYMKVHFSGCSCSHVKDTDKTVRDLGEGHCTIEDAFGDSASPARSFTRTSSHPNMDECQAYPCACIPSSCTVFSQHQKLPKDLLDKCRQVGVHLVNAQRPGHEKKEMRISYSFMERILVRSFPENIGRAFILLKFLFKRLLPKEFGLKSYMAKTLMFHVMEEEVEASSTVEVALRALRLLINFLTSYQRKRRKVCLPHFFQDAPIFFKKPKKEGEDWPDKQKILQRLQEEVDDRLEETVRKFKDQLGVAPNKYFCQAQCLFRDEVDSDINRILKNFDSESALEEVKSLPEHWRTARAALKSLWLLSRGLKEEAASVLAGAPDDEELTVIAGDEESLHRHFSSHTCQWMFGVKDERLKLLPEVVRHFSDRIINLQAVLKLLRLELCGGSFSEEKWHQQLQDGIPDFQEVFVFAVACRSPELLEWAKKKLQTLAVDWDEKLVEDVDEHRRRHQNRRSLLNDEVLRRRLSDCGVAAVDYFVLTGGCTKLSDSQHLWMTDVSYGLSDFSPTLTSHDGFEFKVTTEFTQNSLRLHLYLIWTWRVEWPCETEFVIEVVDPSKPKEKSPACARVQRQSAHPDDKDRFKAEPGLFGEVCVNKHSNFVELSREDLPTYSLSDSSTKILVRVTTSSSAK